MTRYPTAAESDPKILGYMQGLPPTLAAEIRMEDGSSWAFPQIRWAFSNQRQLVPTANIWRGTGHTASLARHLRDDLDHISFTTMADQPMTWVASLEANYTDGIIVLHKGAVIYERYFGALSPHVPHLAMSVTKSFVGLLAEILVSDGLIDPSAPVTTYLPEMAGTAYGDAQVLQVMDMTIGVRYSEEYTDPNAQVWDYARAAKVMPRPADYKGPETIFDFLKKLEKLGTHGDAFAYKTCNAEVLSWIVQRASNTALAELLSTRLWQKLGAEEDAYIAVDRIGTALGGGGLNLTLRDLARVGEMMRHEGKYHGQQIVPNSAVTRIANGASREAFAKAGYDTTPGWSYKSQWWVSHNEFGAYSARGIHGQALWIAPKAELVIARFASHPVASNANGPLDYVSLPAYDALTRHLLRG